MACIVLAESNKQPSQLFEKLLKITKGDQTQAEELYAYFKTPAFIEQFGDWQSELDSSLENKTIALSKLDDNFEPRLFFNSVYGTYFFLDKDNKKVEFPNKVNYLDQTFSANTLRKITKILAYNFIKDRVDDNFNNIDLDAKNKTLRQSITEKIQSKVEELINTSDKDPLQELKIFEAKTLNESLGHVHEWVKKVEVYFKELHLDYVEEEEDQDIEVLEETSREEGSWGVASFEKNSKDNVTANVRLRLSLLQDTEKTDDVFYEPELKEYSAVDADLRSVLSDLVPIIKEDGQIEDIFEMYKNAIEALTEKKPYLKTLVAMLNDPTMPETLKAQFVQAFRVYRNNFIGSRFGRNSKTGTVEHIVQELSDNGSKSQAIKQVWYGNFIEKFLDKKTGKLTKESREPLDNLKNRFEVFSKEFRSKLQNKKFETERDLAEAINSITQILNGLGAETSEKGFLHYLDNLGAGTLDPASKAEGLGKIVGALDFLFIALSKNTIDVSTINPFGTETEFTKLAKAEAFYIEKGSDATIYSGGKTRWIYSYTSYIGTKIKEWKKNPKILENLYNKSPYNQGSHYMGYLLALDIEKLEEREKVSKARLERFELAVFNSLNDEDSSDNKAVDNKTIAKEDAIMDAYNKVLGFRKGAKSFVSTPTPADKSTLYQMAIPADLMINANARVDKNSDKRKVNNSVKEIIFKYIKAEHERMKEAQREINIGENLRMHYHLGEKNGLRFQLMSSLNFENLIDQDLGFNLFDPEGNVITTISLDAKNADGQYYIKDKIMELIEKNIDQQIKTIEKQLVDIGMVSYDEKGAVNRGFDSSIWASYNDDQTLTKVAGDIFINGLVSQVEYAKMFSGDVAYYKSLVDYQKRVPATYVSGKDLYLRPGEEYFNAAVIDSVKIPTPFIDDIREIAPEVADLYENNNSADAQAWITPERWKFLKERLGEWEKSDDLIWDKITGKNSEPFTSSELKRVAQPLKGVYFEINSSVPVFLKYSQAVLVPRFVQGNPQLEGLVKQMNEQKIDELVTFDGIKVGSFAPTVLHNEDGSLKNSEEYSFKPMKLLNSGWKLQQDLPTKTFGPTAVGSQIQKNMLTGLAFNLESQFLVGEEEMSGSDLADHISELITKLSDFGYEGLIKKFGVNEDGKITKSERLREALIAQLRKSSPNVLEALERGLSPLAIPGYNEKIQNIWASIVKKEIIKIKTNGAALIQMSNFGVNKTEADKKGVIWAPWSKSTTYEYSYAKDEDGNIRYSPSGKPIIRPAGALISGSFLAKYIPDYREYDPKELFGTLNKETGKYEGGMIDNEILTNIIGYRIPNQVLASNDALEIAGILPEEMGDTIIAYTGLTTKTGSDFDIDKMYIMMPSFDLKYSTVTYRKAKDWVKGLNLTSEDLQNELDYAQVPYNLTNDEDSDYKELTRLFVEEVLMNPESLSATRNEFLDELGKSKVIGLKYVRPEGEVANMKYKQTQNALIEAYKAVLLNPDVIAQTLNPVDSDVLKNDINFLNPAEEKGDFGFFNISDQIDIKYEFNAGKTGIGQVANNGVDSARTALAQLKLFAERLPMGKSFKNKDGVEETHFDKTEFSEELTDREIEAYVEDYNKTVKKEKDKISVENYKENYRKMKITTSFSVLMNAFVDISKDPFITRGNWVSQTSNVGFMLLRAGAHPFKINALFSQPVIKEFIRYMAHNESILNDETGDLVERYIHKVFLDSLEKEPEVTINGITKTLKEIGIGATGYEQKFEVKKIATMFQTGQNAPEIIAVHEKLNSLSADYGKNKIKLQDYSLTDLRKMKSDNSPFDQIALLKEFSRLIQISKRLTKNIDASKGDVKGYGKNSTQLLITKNLVTDLLNPSTEKGTLVGFDTKLTRNGKPTFLGGYLNNIFRIDQVMQKNPELFLLSSPGIQNLFNHISKQIYNEHLINEDLGDKLNFNFYSYVLSGFSPLQMDAAERKSLANSLPREFKAFKEAFIEEYGEDHGNAFIDNLDIKIGENRVSYLVMSNRKKSAEVESSIVNGWNDLLQTHPEMAERLIKYSYLTSGFQLNLHQFYTYIPYQWFMKNNFNDYLKEVGERYSDTGTIDEAFVRSFFRHNAENNAIAPVSFDKLAKGSTPNKLSGFVIDAKETKSHPRQFIKRRLYDSDPNALRTTYDTHLYEYQGKDKNGNYVYTYVSKLGTRDIKGHRLYEYEYGVDLGESNYKKNIVRKRNTEEGIAAADRLLKEIDDLKKLVTNTTPNEKLAVPLDPVTPTTITPKVQEKLQNVDFTENGITLTYSSAETTLDKPTVKLTISEEIDDKGDIKEINEKYKQLQDLLNCLFS